MALSTHLKRLAAEADAKNQYAKQLNRLKAQKQQTKQIEQAVKKAMTNLPMAKSGSLVIYGDPQSGKTEMMICLTAKLLDEGYKIVVHLLTDSVDLLTQNLDRFRKAGLAPAPRNASDLNQSPLHKDQTAVLFCKKNARDLEKLILALEDAGSVVVMDDEADYATPNGKINALEKTRINERVEELLGDNGKYVGVTATPARLNLNNTFDNRPETWVHFPPHDAYTGQEVFFPQREPVPYRLVRIAGVGAATDAQKALARFLVTSAYLNTKATAEGEAEQNYSMLVHTSGSTQDHAADRAIIEAAMSALITKKGVLFTSMLKLVHAQATELYSHGADALTGYVLANSSRSAIVVLNSTRDRASAGDRPTEPTTPFTIIIGGNIVSRGVTFPNLLAMFFTRDVKTKMQQDTYIQRARMFGARGRYLEHFELTIPASLYTDWKRCFVFHRLALEAIRTNDASPVWIGDPRISIASASSIDRATVDMSKAEMSFPLFDYGDIADLDAIVSAGPRDPETLRRLRKKIGDAMPEYLIDYIESALEDEPDALAVHSASPIDNYAKSADVPNIARPKGFIGNPQLEKGKFPMADHHIKIFYNGAGRARVFYKNTAGVKFTANTKK